MKYLSFTLLAGTLLFGGCSDDSDRRKQAFMQGCMEGGYISKSECACIYGKLDQQTSEEQWQQMERFGVTEEFLLQMQAVTRRCTQR